MVQIVDARNPLLFYCPDLEQYVHEVDENKVCLLLINKADFLTHRQRFVHFLSTILMSHIQACIRLNFTLL